MNYNEIDAEADYKVLAVDEKRRLSHIEYNGKTFEVFYDYYMDYFTVKGDETEYWLPNTLGSWVNKAIRKYDNYTDRVTSYEFMQAVMEEIDK